MGGCGYGYGHGYDLTDGSVSFLFSSWFSSLHDSAANIRKYVTGYC